jgi:hypothetical protein
MECWQNVKVQHTCSPSQCCLQVKNVGLVAGISYAEFADKFGASWLPNGNLLQDY